MSKAKKIILIIFLVLAAGFGGWYLIDTLFRLSIIRIEKPYEPKCVDLAYEDLGSAKFLEGKTAWVSVFASGGTTEWNFSSEEDKALRDEFLSYYPIAAAWLNEQAQKYGHSCEFVYASSPEDDLLYYEARFDADLYDGYKLKQTRKTAGDEWMFISENIDSDAVYEKYGCENIVYVFFLNVGDDAWYNPMALPTTDKPMGRPYELVWQPSNYAGPAVIAHETLHLFGAVDLYGPDDYHVSFHQTQKFVEYCSKNFPTDIMLSTDDASGEFYKDRVTREITDITAYYIGWLDEAPVDIDSFKMLHSQFEKKH